MKKTLQIFEEKMEENSPKIKRQIARMRRFLMRMHPSGGQAGRLLGAPVQTPGQEGRPPLGGRGRSLPHVATGAVGRGADDPHNHACWASITRPANVKKKDKLFNSSIFFS